MLRFTRSHSLRWGIALLGFGACLLVTNVAGLWLADHLGVLGTLVVSSWPLILITAGLLALGHGFTHHVPPARERRTLAGRDLAKEIWK